MGRKQNMITVEKEKGKEASVPLNILVIGDWVIDEDWIMTHERSETSAKQLNEKHYHTTSTNSEFTTTRLCGASLTASAIRWHFANDPYVSCNIYGMGIWHHRDDNYLNYLFQHNALTGSSPFSIVPDTIKEKFSSKLFNLARKEDEQCATMRIVRTFLGHPGTLPKLMSRYDWNLAWKPKCKTNEPSFKELLNNRIKENFEKMDTNDFNAVVLSDFNKGLISEEFIEALISQLEVYCKSQQKLIWFYRTKQRHRPLWENKLVNVIKSRGETIIEFVDPRMARYLEGGKPLFYGSDLTYDGLSLINSYKETNSPKRKVAILFNDNSVIAYDNTNDNVWIIKSSEKPSYLTRGRSSIFLATLVIEELRSAINISEKKKEDHDFGHNCSIGLENGVNWINDCKSIWKKGDQITAVSADIMKAIPNERKTSCTEFGPYARKTISDEWNQAININDVCCIKKEKNELNLEVWRAHTILNQYTVLDEHRKEVIIKLSNAIRAYLELDENDKIRPLISFIKAGPGSGKTFLARCLAKHFGLELFECNIAQMTSLNELSHFFDQVDAAQREGRNIFIFIDEIDNLIKKESVFGYLLDIMWCGQYYRGGLKNSLKPFPGIFAMSGDSKNPVFKNNHPKYEDFESRIFGIQDSLANFTKEESIYLFANLLDRYYGKITYVDKYVLKIIRNLKLEYGPRSLELFISLFRGVKRDSITVENLPTEKEIRFREEHFGSKYAHPSRKTNSDERVKIIYTEE
jgi:hypothetical protein